MDTAAAKAQMEKDAAVVVARHFGGTYERRDGPGAPPKTYDFEVILPEDRIALEVTRAVDGRSLSMWSAIGRANLEAPSLTTWWSITLPHPTEATQVDIRKFARSIESALARVESLGVSEFRFPMEVSQSRSMSPEVTVALSELYKLGVIGGRSMGPPPDGKSFIGLGAVGGGGVVSADDVNRVVEVEARANLEKLRLAPQSRKHLFVWIEAFAEAAMYFGHLPESAPEVDTDIETIWVARWAPGQNFGTSVGTLWKVSPPHEWHNIDPTR